MLITIFISSIENVKTVPYIETTLLIYFYSDLISTMTGGQAEIQNIQPYDVQLQDRKDIGNYDLSLLESQRYYIKIAFIHFHERF